MESLIETYKQEFIDFVDKAVSNNLHFEDNECSDILEEELELPGGYIAYVTIDVYCYNKTVSSGDYDISPYDVGYLNYRVTEIKIYDDGGDLVESAKDLEFLSDEQHW